MGKDGSFSRRMQSRRSRHKRGTIPNMSLIGAIHSVISLNESIIDMGAGTGTYVRSLRELGYATSGIDGTKNIEKLSGGDVLHQSLTTSCELYHGCACWGLLIEVGEHVPVELEDRFLLEVSRIPTTGLMVSWAPPGQKGAGHINCRPVEYVVEKFAELGWVLDEEVTQNARRIVDRCYNNKLLVLKHA